MRPYMPGLAISALSIGLLAALPAAAAPFFSTGDPDGKIATATRPDVGGKFEIKLADDFVLATSNSTVITSATFTGLLTGTNPSVNDVVVEIYRVFPNFRIYRIRAGRPTSRHERTRHPMSRSPVGTWQPPAT